MLPSCLLTPRSEPGRTLHSTGLYLSSRINLSFKQCREMKKKKKKKRFHLANIDRKLSFLFFAGLYSPKAKFLREEIIYPQNLLNKMKAERNSGARDGDGAGIVWGPSALLCHLLALYHGCLSAKGGFISPTFRISSRLTAGRPRASAAIYNEWPPPLQGGCSPPAPGSELLTARREKSPPARPPSTLQGDPTGGTRLPCGARINSRLAFQTPPPPHSSGRWVSPCHASDAHHGQWQDGCPRSTAGTCVPLPKQAGGLVLLTRRFEPPKPAPRRHMLRICRQKCLIQQKCQPAPNRKHLVLVGARGARRGGGTGTTHFPSEQFRPLTKLSPALPGTYIPWECSAQPMELPVLPKTAPPLLPPQQSPGFQEQRATNGWDEQKSKTQTHTHSQTLHNLDFLH